MTLEQFKKAKIEKMKLKEKEAVIALNVVINKIMLASIEKRTQNVEINEADILGILQKTKKELEEERESFAKVNRQEEVESLDKQIAVINEFLPKLMSKEEIKAEIDKLEDKSIPNVMKHFKTNFAGKCDMKVVNEALKN